MSFATGLATLPSWPSDLPPIAFCAIDLVCMLTLLCKNQKSQGPFWVGIWVKIKAFVHQTRLLTLEISKFCPNSSEQAVPLLDPPSTFVSNQICNPTTFLPSKLAASNLLASKSTRRAHRRTKTARTHADVEGLGVGPSKKVFRAVIKIQNFKSISN